MVGGADRLRPFEDLFLSIGNSEFMLEIVQQIKLTLAGVSKNTYLFGMVVNYLKIHILLRHLSFVANQRRQEKFTSGS